MATGRDILLVHEDPLAAAIDAALAPLGRAVVTAGSSAEAMRLLDQSFALIILDMHGGAGFETARLVRSHASARTTPIIVITQLGWHGVEDYELGAFDVLVAPVRPEVLRAKARLFLQLEENERRRDEFLAILAHELRNPLQPLQTAIEVLEHNPDQPVTPRIRGIMQQQVHHLTRLVDDLLDVARLTAGKLGLHRERIALEGIIDDAIAASRKPIETRRHTLVVEHSGKSYVDGDAVRLVQCLVNLIGNAAKFTPPGGRIEVTASIDNDESVVRVVDNGRGISAQLLPTIFEMFVAERVTPDGAGGLGLGLGLVKQIVELHGGTVRASSAGDQRGSEFEIRLPRAT